MLEYDTYIFTRRQEIIIYSGIFAISIAVSFFFYRSVVFSIIILPFLKHIKQWIGEVLIDRRKRELISEFKDFLFMTATSLGSGNPMMESISDSIPKIKEIHGEDALLAKELEIMERRMKQGNENEVDVFMEFAIRTGQEDIIDFVNIYSICLSTGASLITALNRATSVIIDKMTIDREIQEIVRTKRNEGMVIFLMPFVIIIFLNLFSPDYISPLYTTWIGRVIMTFVVVMNIFIYSIIRKIVRIEI